MPGVPLRTLTSLMLALLPASFPARAAESANSLYEQLRNVGVRISAETTVLLPPPFLADGLDAAAQQEVLKKIVGNRFTVKDFTGKVGTAPHYYRVRKLPVAGSDALRAYAVDVAFVAHGGLERVSDRKFLEDLQKKQKDRKVHVLDASELDQRRLRVESSKRRDERYSHVVFLILDRVELSTALHSIVTRQEDSVLAATLVDPRFAEDVAFVNRWRKITLDEEGQRKLSPPQPYSGAGGYLKITALREPEGALLIEYHLIYTEPKGWFNGADPLTTKVPAIIQSEVRSFRQELNRFKR